MPPVFGGIAAGQLVSESYVYFTTAEGLLAYTLTGLVPITFKGTAGNDFLRDTLQFEVPIRQLPIGKGLQLVRWAPFVTLNSISNDGTAVNAGWAVDDFTIPFTEAPMTAVSVKCDLAVRDIDGYVLRVGYQIHLLGSLVDLPGPPR
jgi:hypothetical protein